MWSRVLRHSTAVAIVLGAFTDAIAFRVSAFEAFGADAYGYVSQAHLWTAGNLVQHEPLSSKAPWSEPEWTFSPLGYRPGLQPGTIVPTYPPGLPLLMAGFLVLFGRDGPFFVVPLLGGLSVVAAFLLGRRVAGEVCGLATAALLLTSPVFSFQLKEPMSDVPVTAWWLLAILLTSRSTPGLILAGGLATSAAIVTRPNLVPLAAVLGMFVLLYSAKELAAPHAECVPVLRCGRSRLHRRRRRQRQALWFAVFVRLRRHVRVVQHRVISGPISRRYSRWLLDMETAFILLAPVGWFLLRRREGSDDDAGVRTGGRLSNLFAVFAVVLYGCYATYLPFDNWTFLRFLLPAISLLLLLCALTVSELGERLHSFSARFLFVACFVVFLAWRWDVTGLKPLTPHDRRSAVIGEYVQDHLPPNAIVFSIFHSGSIRYYSGRSTLRWDWLPADWLDRSVVFLTSNGYQPYLLIEDNWERHSSSRDFRATRESELCGLTPVATYSGGTRV